MAATRRALLYVPASSQKMLDKSHSLHVDCVVYDLEDSVAEDSKEEARKRLRHFLDGRRPEGIKEIAVRINAVDTAHALADLMGILPSKHLDALVIPKTQSPSDLHFINEVLRHVLPERHPRETSLSSGGEASFVRLLPLIESAKGLLGLADICRASPYLSAVVFAAEDFTLDLGITRSEGLPELQMARSQIVATARAFGVESIIDLVCTAYKDEGGRKQLEMETLVAKRLGFTGKQCIHPAQVDVVQRTFAPSPDEVEWAARVVIANEKAVREGKGAWSLDGQMIDLPVIGRAKGVLAKAQVCDLDVSAVKERFVNQEPE